MTHHVLSVILSLSVFGMTASAAFAQTPSRPVQKSTSRSAVEAAKIDSLKLQLTEDIEIMRRLLDATVKELYATVSTNPVPGMPQFGSLSNSRTVEAVWSKSIVDAWRGNRNPNLQIREPIGTYLNGHGVVYQLELPSLREPHKTVVKKSLADCPFMSLSNWERTRKHISGELKKINCGECHAGKNFKSVDASFKAYGTGSGNSRLVVKFALFKPSASGLTWQELAERLIDLLAENGHHIRTLPSSQSLTLSVTFRHPLSARQADKQMSNRIILDFHGLSPGASKGSSKVFAKSSFGISSSRILPQNIKRTQKKNTNASGAASGSFGIGVTAGGLGGTSAKLGNEELAGDLHMRQENFKKAAEEYEKALKKASSLKQIIQTTPFKVELARKPPENRRLLRKLAVAQLQGGDITKAKAVLDKLAAIESTRRSSPPKEPETPSVSLPARLVISVTKANLDAVAAGKMSREEFRKQVSVDYFDPASVKAKQDDTKQSKS